MTDFLNAIVLFTNFVGVPALAYGSQLALGALGVTLVYGILRFSNFAHGEIMSFGTMVAIPVMWGIQSQGISIAPLPTVLLARLQSHYCCDGLAHRPNRISLLSNQTFATGHLAYRIDRRDVYLERCDSLRYRTNRSTRGRRRTVCDEGPRVQRDDRTQRRLGYQNFADDLFGLPCCVGRPILVLEQDPHREVHARLPDNEDLVLLSG